MPMNSYSFRGGGNHCCGSSEHEIEELLELHPEGEAFPVNPRHLANEPYQPLDIKRLYEEVDPNDRRGAPRYELQLTVLIANHCQAFRTQSRNVSATGLLLKDFLPEDFSKHTFDIILIQTHPTGQKSFFRFRGKAVEGPLRSRRVHFEATTRDTEHLLQQAFQGLKPTG